MFCEGKLVEIPSQLRKRHFKLCEHWQPSSSQATARSRLLFSRVKVNVTRTNTCSESRWAIAQKVSRSDGTDKTPHLNNDAEARFQKIICRACNCSKRWKNPWKGCHKRLETLRYNRQISTKAGRTHNIPALQPSSFKIPFQIIQWLLWTSISIPSKHQRGEYQRNLQPQKHSFWCRIYTNSNTAVSSK